MMQKILKNFYRSKIINIWVYNVYVMISSISIKFKLWL